MLNYLFSIKYRPGYDDLHQTEVFIDVHSELTENKINKKNPQPTEKSASQA